MGYLGGAVGERILAEVVTDRNGRSHLILYPGFLRRTRQEQRGDAWHETIHVITGWTDEQAFMRLAPFGLRLTVPGTVDISTWPRAISTVDTALELALNSRTIGNSLQGGSAHMQESAEKIYEMGSYRMPRVIPRDTLMPVSV